MSSTLKYIQKDGTYRSHTETFEMNLIVWSQIMWPYWYLLSHLVSVNMIIVSAIKHEFFIF